MKLTSVDVDYLWRKRIGQKSLLSYATRMLRDGGLSRRQQRHYRIMRDGAVKSLAVLEGLVAA